MKIAPLLRAFKRDARFDAKLVHTGQHYDNKLSNVFFEELHIPRPDIELDVGSGSHAQQTAEIIKRFEPVLAEHQPHGVLVVGDVNSTIGCALVASKFFRNDTFLTTHGERRRPVIIHVEAGLRSNDADMPEEINRLLTDAISDLLFVSEPSGMANLEREGVTGDRAQFVGNVMIDTLLDARERAQRSTILDTMGLAGRKYGLLTLHRPSNVDDPVALRSLLAVLDRIARDMPLVFPVHPRTRQRLASAGISFGPGWHPVDPLGYLDFLRLMSSAAAVFTDSGGVQEETTVLGVPCITLRENTERPVTIDEGTNQLAGVHADAILSAYEKIDTIRKAARIPQLWDGRSAERIVDALGKYYG